MEGSKASGGATSWSGEADAGIEYVASRTPYPPYLPAALFAFHDKANLPSNASQAGNYDAALDLGCGPGQLALHLATRFGKVYGRDPSESMIAMAKSLSTAESFLLAERSLPKPDVTKCKLDFQQGNAEEPNLPSGEQVDVIAIGSAAHWFDWSTPESRLKLWSRWTTLLRPNGSLFVLGLVPIVGSWTGPDAEKTRPLRQLIRGVAFDKDSPIRQYYSLYEAKLGSIEFYKTLPMPWEETMGDEALAKAWRKESRSYLVFDYPHDIIYPDHLVKPESDTPLPDWLPQQSRKAVSVGSEPGDGYEYADQRWKTTTPRKMAQWMRTASGSIQWYKEHPEDKLMIGRDDDMAARAVKKACEQGGLGYDEEVELHNAASLLTIRRSEEKYECDWPKK